LNDTKKLINEYDMINEYEVRNERSEPRIQACSQKIRLTI